MSMTTPVASDNATVAHAVPMDDATARALTEHADALLREHVYPLEQVLLDDGFAAVEPRLEAVREVVEVAGLWAPFLPVAWGGRGMPLMAYARLSEVLGQTPLGHYAFHCQAPDVGNMEVLLAHGSEAQHERFLRPLAAGTIRSCFAMTEPGHAGSNPVWMSTTARVDGDDFVIDGRKWFTSSADGADFAVVMAVTDPDAPPHQRASQILVPLDTPGFEMVRNISVMGDVGSGWMSHAEIAFEGCRVPKHHLLGARGAGFAIAQERLGPGRIHHCMRWIGICERAFDLMCQRAATRELSPGRFLGSKQAVQHAIAECRAAIHGARLMVLDAARAIDERGARAARVEISTIKFTVAQTLCKVLDHAIQVHGALGMTDDTLLSYWFRHERAARIYDGADEVHKTVVAREILKSYGLLSTK